MADSAVLTALAGPFAVDATRRTEIVTVTAGTTTLTADAQGGNADSGPTCQLVGVDYVVVFIVGDGLVSVKENQKEDKTI